PRSTLRLGHRRLEWQDAAAPTPWARQPTGAPCRRGPAPNAVPSLLEAIFRARANGETWTSNGFLQIGGSRAVEPAREQGAWGSTEQASARGSHLVPRGRAIGVEESLPSDSGWPFTIARRDGWIVWRRTP